jgi:hypothetical protein
MSRGILGSKSTSPRPLGSRATLLAQPVSDPKRSPSPRPERGNREVGVSCYDYANENAQLATGLAQCTDRRNLLLHKCCCRQRQAT